MKTVSVVLVGLGLIALVSCGGGCEEVDSDGQCLHSCDQIVNYSDGWFFRGLLLMHDEPRSCPVPGVSAYDIVDASGVVVDGGTHEFTTGTLAALTSAKVQMNSYQGYFVNGPLGWQVGLYTSYPAATVTYQDYLKYHMDSGQPWAEIMVDYSGGQMTTPR